MNKCKICNVDITGKHVCQSCLGKYWLMKASDSLPLSKEDSNEMANVFGYDCACEVV